MTYEIHITHRCNLKCPSCCVMCDIVNDPTSDLTMDEVKDIVDQINAIDRNIHTIRVSGGEATIHPQCMDICMYLKNNIKNARQFAISTNFSNKRLLDEIHDKLYFDISELDHTTDAKAAAENKVNKHIALMISPTEAGLGLYDPRGCFALTDSCGIAVHKWRGKLCWSWCGNGASVTKLLQKESKFLKPTLKDLLGSDITTFFNEICPHCHFLAEHKLNAKDNIGVVSNCFKEGFEAMKKYNEEVNKKVTH